MLLKLIPEEGEELEACAIAACKITHKLGMTVTFNYNNRRILVPPDLSVGDVEEIYYTGCYDKVNNE